MKKRKNNKLLVILSLVTMPFIYLIFTYYLMPSFLPDEDKIMRQGLISRKPVQVETQPQKIYLNIMESYNFCGHEKLIENKVFDYSIEGIEALRKVYKVEDGWTHDLLNGQYKISKNIDGLCPEDEGKKHIGVVGEYIGVYKGPKGFQGELERVTDIRFNSLPSELQEKIYSDDFTFENEAELLEVLDSFDEYGE